MLVAEIKMQPEAYPKEMQGNGSVAGSLQVKVENLNCIRATIVVSILLVVVVVAIVVVVTISRIKEKRKQNHNGCRMPYAVRMPRTDIGGWMDARTDGRHIKSDICRSNKRAG